MWTRRSQYTVVDAVIVVLAVIGTRPEAIKMAPVVADLRSRPEQIRCVVCSTGQHRQMVDQVFSSFKIPIDVDLEVMRPNQSLASLTAALFSSFDRVVTEHHPDWILAQGDTTSVMVCSLVAFYQQRRFAHVEAGLRTYDKLRPFPEEINRRVADLVTDLYFAPTSEAKAALLREGYAEDRIVVTGNTVIDSLLEVAARPYDWDRGPLRNVSRERRIVTITAHRRESFGGPFRELCLAIRELADRYTDDVSFVYPVHLNPAVQQPVRELLSDHAAITLLDPLDYDSLVHLLKASYLVLTDSGGIQEEAPSLQVPVLVMRDTTERPEGVQAGVAKLIGTQRSRIVEEVDHYLTHPQARAAMTAPTSPYGDGRAAARIVDTLLGLKCDEFTATR